MVEPAPRRGVEPARGRGTRVGRAGTGRAPGEEGSNGQFFPPQRRVVWAGEGGSGEAEERSDELICEPSGEHAFGQRTKRH